MQSPLAAALWLVSCLTVSRSCASACSLLVARSCLGGTKSKRRASHRACFPLLFIALLGDGLVWLSPSCITEIPRLRAPLQERLTLDTLIITRRIPAVLYFEKACTRWSVRPFSADRQCSSVLQRVSHFDHSPLRKRHPSQAAGDLVTRARARDLLALLAGSGPR